MGDRWPPQAAAALVVAAVSGIRLWVSVSDSSAYSILLA
jgi:hypothetical protein